MVIIRGGKIINPLNFPFDELQSIVVKRKTKYSHDLHRTVVTDKLSLIECSIYMATDWDLFPGDIIKHGVLTITVEDISKLDSDSRKDFYCEKLSQLINDQVMLDKNLK